MTQFINLYICISYILYNIIFILFILSLFFLFACAVFRIVLDKIGLLGRVDPQKAKKWDNLKKKYKVSAVLNNLYFCEPLK